MLLSQVKEHLLGACIGALLTARKGRNRFRLHSSSFAPARLTPRRYASVPPPSAPPCPCALGWGGLVADFGGVPLAFAAAARCRAFAVGYAASLRGRHWRPLGTLGGVPPAPAVGACSRVRLRAAPLRSADAVRTPLPRSPRLALSRARFAALVRSRWACPPAAVPRSLRSLRARSLHRGAGAPRPRVPAAGSLGGVPPPRLFCRFRGGRPPPPPRPGGTPRTCT